MSVPYSSFVPSYAGYPYSEMRSFVASCSDFDIIVEVGAFLGHGVCYICEQLAMADRRPKFYAIDTWDEPSAFCQGAIRRSDMPWGESMDTWRARGGRLYDSFRFYLDGSPCTDRLYDHVQFPPGSCMDEFVDGTVALVLLNYSQNEKDIENEIKRWWPKLRTGGKILIAATEMSPPRVMTKE